MIYVTDKDDKTLFIENIDDSSEINEIVKLDNTKIFDTYDSIYHSKMDKQSGICITVRYSEKDTSGNYGMQYCYTKDKEIKEYPIKEGNFIKSKW